MTQQIDRKIITKLNERGFKTVRRSTAGKLVEKFEKDPNSKILFNLIWKKPSLRVLGQVFCDKLPITRDQIGEILKTKEPLKRALSESPDKNLLCRSCSSVIGKYNIYEGEKPAVKVRCVKCNTLNLLSRCEEKDDWTFPAVTIAVYLDQLAEVGMFTPNLLADCSKCSESRYIVPLLLDSIRSLRSQKLKEYVESFYCKRCNRIYDLTRVYTAPDHVAKMWGKQGYWLEWYVKQILKKKLPTFSMEQGILLRNGKTEKEVDAVLLMHDKIISFECKAISPRTRASFSDVSDALKLLDFSDKVVLVTTTMIKENEKESLVKRGEQKLVIVEGPAIEKIAHLL